MRRRYALYCLYRLHCFMDDLEAALDRLADFAFSFKGFVFIALVCWLTVLTLHAVHGLVHAIGKADAAAAAKRAPIPLDAPGQ